VTQPGCESLSRHIAECSSSMRDAHGVLDFGLSLALLPFEELYWTV
jgi:hypothetical protein